MNKLIFKSTKKNDKISLKMPFVGRKIYIGRFGKQLFFACV